jgi:Transposase.
VGEEIAPTFYETAAFDALKGRVRSGDIAVNGSRRHRTFEGYLLPQPHFEQLVQKQQTRLAVADEAVAYLTTKQQEIKSGLVALQESIGKIEGSLVLDEKGMLHLPPLEKEIPAEVERMRVRVSHMLPHVKLPELLLEVDN